MKRSLAELQRNEHATDEDDRRRVQQRKKKARVEVLRKQEQKESNFIQKWRGYLAKWDGMGLEPLTLLTIPSPVPARPPSPPLTPFPHFV